MAGLAHLGVGFALKKAGPKVNVLILLFLSVWLDLVWMISGLLGIPEEYGGYLSHSLIGAAGWAVIGLGITFLAARQMRPAVVVAAAVLSHWVLDAVVWPMTAVIPDSGKMPLWFSQEPSVGLGVYKTMAGVIIGEVGITGAGIFLYILSRKERNIRRTPVDSEPEK